MKSIGEIIVKYDMEVCGEYQNLDEALERIRTHHLAEHDKSELANFEFFLVTADRIGTQRYTVTGPEGGYYDVKTRRQVINGTPVVRLGYLLAPEAVDVCCCCGEEGICDSEGYCRSCG